jgi:hypothetical protein
LFNFLKYSVRHCGCVGPHHGRRGAVGIRGSDATTNQEACGPDSDGFDNYFHEIPIAFADWNFAGADAGGNAIPHPGQLAAPYAAMHDWFL